MLLKKGIRSAAAYILAVIMAFSFPISAAALTTSTSPYTNKMYTHSSAFDGYDRHDGIDVSSYQGTIDWSKVKQDGIEFAVIRAGYTGYTQKRHSINADTQAVTNIKNAQAAGLPVGVYWFSQALNESEARAEAQKTLEIISGYDLQLPVFFDYEFYGVAEGRLDSAWREGTITKSQMTANARAFCSTIENAGYEAAIYANKSFLTNQLDAAGLAKDYGIWLAHFTTQTDYTGDYYMWQYTEEGKVDGISGSVDCDFMYLPAGSDIGKAPVAISKDITVVLNNTSYEFTGKPLGPGMKVTDGNGNILARDRDYTLQYNGKRIEPGTYSVTISFIGRYEGIAPITKEFEITESKVNVKLNRTSYEYTGYPLGPGLTVTDSKGNVLVRDKDEYTGYPLGPGLTVTDSKGNVLVRDKDYTLKYNGQRTEPGTYSVTVTLIGNYRGTIEKEFEITDSKVNVKLNRTSYEYTGAPLGPGLTVTDSKGNVLVRDKDYTLKYNGERIQPGTYSVTVTLIGNGNYRGSVTSEFKIV